MRKESAKARNGSPADPAKPTAAGVPRAPEPDPGPAPEPPPVPKPPPDPLPVKTPPPLERRNPEPFVPPPPPPNPEPSRKDPPREIFEGLATGRSESPPALSPGCETAAVATVDLVPGEALPISKGKLPQARVSPWLNPEPSGQDPGGLGGAAQIALRGIEQ